MVDILKADNEDILDEMSVILGVKYNKPPGREKIGFITEQPETYIKDGIVDDNKLKALYNSSSFLNDYAVTLAINSLRNRPRDLFALIKSVWPGMKVLEYGCGTGTHGIAAMQRGANVDFFDISTFMLGVVKQRLLYRDLTSSLLTDNESYIKDNTYNHIYCTDVIEHHPNPVDMLQNFIRWGKEGCIMHLHISRHVCYERGHLKQSIDAWDGPCQELLTKHFDKVSDNNYLLVSK